MMCAFGIVMTTTSSTKREWRWYSLLRLVKFSTPVTRSSGSESQFSKCPLGPSIGPLMPYNKGRSEIDLIFPSQDKNDF